MDALAIADYTARDALLASAREHGTRFGRSKVYLATIPALELGNADHRRILEALRRSGLVRLARADLVAAMPAELVAASEVSAEGACWHFLLVEA